MSLSKRYLYLIIAALTVSCLCLAYLVEWRPTVLDIDESRESAINSETLMSIDFLKQCAPADWTVEIVSLNGHGRAIYKLTTPPLKTTGSDLVGASFFGKTEPISIYITVLPNFSKKMLADILAYNHSIANLDGSQEHDDGQNGPQLEPVQLPMFMGAKLGFTITPLSRVPALERDAENIFETFTKICSDWKPCDDRTEHKFAQSTKDLLSELLLGKLPRGNSQNTRR
ncbi:MAG: hypothetical protein AAFN77_10785 [Planctomycetota bacterium]